MGNDGLPSDLNGGACGRNALISALGRASRAMPVIRGKNRLCLAILRALGAESRSTALVVSLTQPVEYRAELNLHSWLQRLAFVSGSYEPDTVKFLLRLFQAYPRRGSILDIGANVGLVAIPLAILLRRLGRPGDNTVVYAIEAVSDNFAQLERNVKLNGLEGAVRPFNVALGDHAKAVDIQVEGNLARGEGSGTASILPDGSTYECTRIPIMLRQLDEMVRTGEIDAGVSVIKIDTDGYDLKIFEGAREFLVKSRPVAFGEFNAHCLSWHGQSIASVRAYAKEIGYEVFPKLPSGFLFSRTTHDASYVQDLLFVPGEYVSRYSWCLS